MQGLTAFERHKRLLREYEAYYGEKPPSQDIRSQATKTDLDTLKEQYRFLRTEEDDKEGKPWEIALARRYYSRLFREYAIVDLSRYKEGKLGCRWRVHAEVLAGRGQFSCGAKGCSKTESLETLEVPFTYKEADKQKHALVKVRLCQEHGMQLNYSKNKEAFDEQLGKRKKGKDSASDSGKQRVASDAHSMPKGAVKYQKLQNERGSVEAGKGRPEALSKTKTASALGLEAEVDKFLSDLLF